MVIALFWQFVQDFLASDLARSTPLGPASSDSPAVRKQRPQRLQFDIYSSGILSIAQPGQYFIGA
jgi:hypothetical protein